MVIKVSYKMDTFGFGVFDVREELFESGLRVVEDCARDLGLW